MSRVDRERLEQMWSDHGVAVKEIAAACGVSVAYVTKLKTRWNLPARPHGLAQSYSIDGPAIGADLKHMTTLERDRRCADDELERLRACASRPSYR